ncbi:MAG: tetratricopeptide repeat protein [Planctomycetota bacterium]|jgi:hypothetical protein
MKAEHRHELKTNALAEWLAHSPDWARQNLIYIVIVGATIVGLGVYVFWRGHTKSARLDEQYSFTGVVNQLSNYKMQILGSQGEAADQSFLLLNPVGPLEDFARGTDDDNLAALALIKKAEAVRSQLHYRRETVNRTDLTSQIEQAKQSYTRALDRAGNNASLTAAAKFGLGLCEEELGNFDQARKIYTEIAEAAAFEGTGTVKQARLRLDTMADYQANVVFRPRPEPEVIKIEPVTIDFGPGDPNKSTAATQPKVTLEPVDTNAPAVEPNKTAARPQVKPAPIEPNGAATKPEVEVDAPVEVETKSETPAVTIETQDSNSTPKVTDPNASSR